MASHSLYGSLADKTWKEKQLVVLKNLNMDQNGLPLPMYQKKKSSFENGWHLRFRLLERTALVVGGGVYLQ